MSERTALILGATGGVGGEVARRLSAAGWRMRALHRDPARVRERIPGVEWRQGDAMRSADVVAAAQGADVIVHAVNPPGYRDWDRLVLPMLAATIAAAQASGARIVLPGNVYNYGLDAFPLIAEDAPQNPTTRKGRIRVEMERRLRAAAERGVRTLAVRAGDFFGPRAANNWFSQALVKPGGAVRTVTNPAAPGVGHQWAYLPDVADTMVRLLEREGELAPFAAFHMDGHWDPDGTAFPAAIARVIGGRPPAVRRFPWPLVTLAAPVVPLFRELAEMRYLWRTAARMDNSRLVRLLGREPHTPLDEAVRETLIGLGCLSSGHSADCFTLGLSH